MQLTTDMKLAFRRFELELTRTWRISTGLDGEGTNSYGVVFVELADARGRRGLGEGAPSSRYGANVDTVEAFLTKIDPSGLSFDDVAGSERYLTSLTPDDAAARCAVNLALLDGAARTVTQPVCDYLGLGFTEARHVTSFSIGIDKPDVMEQKVL